MGRSRRHGRPFAMSPVRLCAFEGLEYPDIVLFEVRGIAGRWITPNIDSTSALPRSGAISGLHACHAEQTAAPNGRDAANMSTNGKPKWRLPLGFALFDLLHLGERHNTRVDDMLLPFRPPRPASSSKPCSASTYTSGSKNRTSAHRSRPCQSRVEWFWLPVLRWLLKTGIIGLKLPPHRQAQTRIIVRNCS